MATTFTINGVPYTVKLNELPADITLNTFIREHAQLTATKFMCLEGGCGVCVCVVSGKHPVSGKKRTWAVNSCLTLLNSCANWEITTAEGLGNKSIGYHPIQKRLAKMNGSQCGFCSPGFVMNMYGLLESKNGQVTMEEVENSFGGNLCRCTGYRPILDTMKSFAVDSSIGVPPECRDIEDLSMKSCPKTGELCTGRCQNSTLTELTYDDGTQWHWPKTLTQLFAALGTVGANEYMLVGGNTAHGVYRRPESIKTFIDVNSIPELNQYSINDQQLKLGSNLSLSETMEVFLEAAKRPGFEYCQQLWRHFDLIANVPVRNTGTLAGNIATKKAYPEFPSDVFIIFECLDAQVIISEDGNNQQTVPISAYLSSTLTKSVIITFVLKAYPKDKYIFNSYKIMPRAQNAHAYVNAAFLLELDITNGTVNDSRICFGGINPSFVHANAVEGLLKGSNIYAQETVTKVFNNLPKILQPDSVLPDASPEYRMKLACGLLYKFMLAITPTDKVKSQFKSGGSILQRPLSSGIQKFKSDQPTYPVNQPVEKLEAQIQTAGEATYMNDTLTTSNSVYCAFVTAKRVGATIEEIDATEALRQPGVVAFYSAKDIPGTNTFIEPSFGLEAEEIFCSGPVKYYDQPLGVIAALTSDIAHLAVEKVKVMYTNGAKTVLPTVADVLEAKALERVKTMAPSSIEAITLSGDPEISGTGIFEMGLQYHFTMEPQTTIAVPFEDGLQVWSATQWTDHTQCVIAKMLQIKVHDVQLKVRRLGGAYGCKISRGNQVACTASLVAHKLNRPARFVQRIESMMNCNGKRWACFSEYEFHLNKDGKILGLTNTFYQDAGWSLNESPVEGHSIICAKNCYQLTDSNCKIEGKGVVTDAPSSTWCRAPGSVEGIAMIENILEHMAFEAKKDPADVRLANIKPGNKLLELLPRFLDNTEYRKRRKEIDQCNDENRWMKRGLGLAIMEYPIFYFGQYPATVSIYHSDGTVVISHGGIEMGQGMNTKIAQVAAFVLGIPLELVKIESSDTINGANAMVTGGAVGSESLCYAVRKACDTLNERLKPVKDAKKKSTWKEIVQEAWGRNINLIASDLYKVGDMQNYNIYGIALTEVEVDILTGNHLIKRVDILEDAGKSLSPYIDIGQIEGAFVMCLGYWLSEQLVYDQQTGQLLTNRTWNYKVPGAKDIPIDFRIELVQNSVNTGGFMGSKATGEPPCCLAVSVIFALQHALQSARNDAGLKREWVRLGAPTTTETVLLNAGNDINSFSLK